MKEEDKQFTACEIQVKFHKFNCHIFGVSIAVIAFQKNIDVFVDQNMLERTYPYLDDVIIGGRSKEEHNMNVKNFAKKWIVRYTTSPRRAQEYVVKDQERSLLIDYSMTVNLFTRFDAYSFGNMKELLNNASGNLFLTYGALIIRYH